MKFYGRNKEVESLIEIRQRSHRHAQMTVLTGRRRVGKTRLIKESLKGELFLYFFLSRKEEPLLCAEFREQIKQTLGIEPIGDFSRFQQVFQWLCQYSRTKHLNLVIDEFQEFFRINSSIYSEIQHLWDSNKEEVKMNLILSGSIQSLMRKIFESYHEPLFGRATAKLFLRPFGVNELRDLMIEHKPDALPIDLLTFYTITGGVPKYVEYFIDQGLLKQAEFFDAFFDDRSFFLDEGKALLLDEFGKDYGTYFSILALISSGKTDRGAITSVIQRDIGGHLKRLEEDYSIIRAHRPMFSKPGSRNLKFFIDDNFLSFWFRFVFKYNASIELENYDMVIKLINRDFSTYAGRFLEKFIRKQLAESMQFSHVGNYWQRGNQNEIDVIAYNELTKQAIIGEVKMKRENISLDVLKLKAQEVSRQLGGYDISYQGYALEDLLT